MNYEKRDAVVTKAWQAVRRMANADLMEVSQRELVRERVQDALQTVEPDSKVTVIGAADGILRLKWTGADEIVQIRKAEGVVEVRVGP